MSIYRAGQSPVIVFFLLLFTFSPLQLLFGEDTVYEFGPKTDTVIVFTASADSSNQSTTATLQLHEFAQKLAANPPSVHIMIALTQSDISELPADIPVKRYRGTKELIKKLSPYSNAAVCCIGSGSRDRARIITGTSQGTSPAWLLRPAYNCLQQERIAIDFYTNAVVFHRLGWLPDDPQLRLYNESQIPAIKIETNADLAGFFDSFAAAAVQNISNDRDIHYFVWQVQNKLVITGEQHIIVILIVSSIIFLSWLIIFSFLFGKKQEQHIRDLLVLWWMPLYFFLVNWGCLFLGSKITEFLFYTRFASYTEMNAFPLTALAVKYVFALFFMFVFTAFNKVIPLPANRFLYGFMGHAVCLLNIFVFSFINLSFSVIFMAIYLISLSAYHFKQIPVQIIFLICLFLPLIPFVQHLILYRYFMFSLIFPLQIAPACIFVPFDLFLIRLSLSIDKKRKKKEQRMYIPLQCILTGTGFILLALWVFVMPAPADIPHKPFTLVYTLNGKEDCLVKKYADSEEIISDYYREYDHTDSEAAEQFLTVQTSLENYFERSIGTIQIASPLKVEAFSITVQTQNGVAVFESDAAFEQNASGDIATVISFPRPELPFVMHFSGKKDAALTVSVILWSKENPYGIRLADDSGHFYNTHTRKPYTAETAVPDESPFLLKIERKLQITAE